MFQSLLMLAALAAPTEESKIVGVVNLDLLPPTEKECTFSESETDWSIGDTDWDNCLAYDVVEITSAAKMICGATTGHCMARAEIEITRRCLTPPFQNCPAGDLRWCPWNTTQYFKNPKQLGAPCSVTTVYLFAACVCGENNNCTGEATGYVVPSDDCDETTPFCSLDLTIQCKGCAGDG
jgi:hypothetical protein